MCVHCGDKTNYISRAPEKDIICSECNNLIRKGAYLTRQYIETEYLSRVHEHAGLRLK